MKDRYCNCGICGRQAQAQEFVPGVRRYICSSCAAVSAASGAYIATLAEAHKALPIGERWISAEAQQQQTEENLQKLCDRSGQVVSPK